MQLQYSQGAFTQAQKRPPLGPPPSARRGPASYYPEVAPVHPIVEETDSLRSSMRGGRESAASNAIPIGIPDYYLRGNHSMASLPGANRPVSGFESEYSQDDHADPSPVSSLRPEEVEGQSWREPSPEPVRKASLGRKSKPVLTTVKSNEKIRRGSGNDGRSSLPSQRRSRSESRGAVPVPAIPKGFDQADESPQAFYEESSDDETFDEKTAGEHKALEMGGAAAVAGAAVNAPQQRFKPDLSARTPSSEVLGPGEGILDPSNDAEKEAKKENSKEQLGSGVTRKPSRELLGANLSKSQSRNREPSPLSKETGIDDARLSDILAELEKGGALTSEETAELRQPKGGLSERAGKRRPPRLDVDAVRSAEARGSLTSLPDLIMRATRLASNLDRGKTASRLGMQGWLDGADNEGQKNKRKSGLSEILSSFPAPGAATPPPGSRQEMRRSRTWGQGSNLRHSALPSDSDAGEFGGQKKRQRRCCGMPLWLFIMLMVLLLLLIAAAVVIPVVLVVLPEDDDGSGSSSDSALAQCKESLTCQNGGVNVVTSSGDCQCLCVSGYTGSMCGTAGSAACTTTSIGSTSDATLGDAIPRLLSGASNYSIPLDGETILGLFSGNDLSCNSENALVSFNNNAGAKRSLDEQPGLSPTPTLVARQAATSNGIIYATGAPPDVVTSARPTASATPTSSSAPASSSPTSSSSPASSATIQDNSVALDFARVAVLYVLQASGDLDPAITAQSRLQSYFDDGRTSQGQTVDASKVALGNGFTCDLSAYSISQSNGTVVGGGGN